MSDRSIEDDLAEAGYVHSIGVVKRHGRDVLRAIVFFTDNKAPNLPLSVIWDKTPVRIIPLSRYSASKQNKGYNP